jgi:hypothetical protein
MDERLPSAMPPNARRVNRRSIAGSLSPASKLECLALGLLLVPSGWVQ